MIQWRIAAMAGLLVAFAGLLWLTWARGVATGEREVQAKWNAEKLEAAQAMADAQVEARRKERELQAAMDNLRRDKDAEARRIAANLQRVIDGLRDRPERPVPSTTSTAGSPVACTGSQLFRPDAEFLARESERADQLRIALQQCQAVYEAARRKLAASP